MGIGLCGCVPKKKKYKANKRKKGKDKSQTPLFKETEDANRRSSVDEQSDYRGYVEEQNLLQSSQDPPALSSKQQLATKSTSSSSSSSSSSSNDVKNVTADPNRYDQQTEEKVPDDILPKTSKEALVTTSTNQNVSHSSSPSSHSEQLDATERKQNNLTETDAAQAPLSVVQSKSISSEEKLQDEVVTPISIEENTSSSSSSSSSHSSVSSFELISEKEISTIVVEEKQQILEDVPDSNQTLLPAGDDEVEAGNSLGENERQYKKTFEQTASENQDPTQVVVHVDSNEKHVVDQDEVTRNSLSNNEIKESVAVSNAGEAYLSIEKNSHQNQDGKQEESSSTSDDEEALKTETELSEIPVASVNQVQLNVVTSEDVTNRNGLIDEEPVNNQQQNYSSSSSSSQTSSLASSDTVVKAEDFSHWKEESTEKVDIDNNLATRFETAEQIDGAEAITNGTTLEALENGENETKNEFYPDSDPTQIIKKVETLEDDAKSGESDSSRKDSSSSSSSSDDDEPLKENDANAQEETPGQNGNKKEESTSLDAEGSMLPKLVRKHRENITFRSGWRKIVQLVDLVKAHLVSEETVDQLEKGEIDEDDVARDLQMYLEGDEPVAGLLLMETGEKMSFHDASKKRLLRRGTAIRLLEAQAATGSIVNPYTGAKMSVEDAEKAGLIDKFLSSALVRAERAACGFKSKLFDEPLPLFEAMKRNLVVESHGIRLLEAQIATGGIIDPLANHRIPVEVAYERGLFDEKLNKILENPEDDTKGFFDPNTNQNLTYLQLIERCVVDEETSLKLLPLYNKKQKKDYWKS